ncbi:MAG: hypothetical protein Q8867_02905 [Bacteroidota bacterium]|nr:hypothetical protein [Bacteroidota bacterium]
MKKRFPFVSMGLCVITWALTFFLFFFLNTSSEKSTAFCFSLGYTVFLEFLFFFYIGFLKATRSGLTKAVFAPVYGIVNLSYIITGALLLLAWNIFLTEIISFRIFIAVLIIVTTGFVIFGGLIGKIQMNHHETTAAEKESSNRVEDLKSEFIRAEMRFASVVKQKGLKYNTQSSYSTGFDSLVNPVKFLPANALHNEAVSQGLLEVLHTMNAWIDQTASSDFTQEQWETHLSTFIRDTRAQIDFAIKSSHK